MKKAGKGARGGKLEASSLLSYVTRKRILKSSDVAREFKVSRQAASRRLSALCEGGVVLKSGSTRNALYTLASREGRSKTSQLRSQKISLLKNLKGLEEDVVFAEFALRFHLKKKLSPNAYKIVQYAFTEMLNNAIDHSESKRVVIDAEWRPSKFFFKIKDTGVGVFQKVRKSFALKNDFEAMEHVLKGKQTTDSKRHSGQGIFFTSRVADRFELQSSVLKVIVDQDVNDTFLEKCRTSRGTTVTFWLRPKSLRDLSRLFNEYSNDDFEFDRNSVRIKLSRFEGLLSRSQAKRLLIGLDQYSRIEFDFKGVRQIGQAFADEIFRVYARHHPKAVLTYTHAEAPVAYLIERARKESL